MSNALLVILAASGAMAWLVLLAPHVAPLWQAPAVCTANGPLPDATPGCTPGAFNPAVTQATIGATICVRGWTATIRPPVEYTNRLKRQQMAEYGITGDPSEWEEDHFLALENGGHPTDPHNLWPQAWNRADHWDAHHKDHAENVARAMICAGTITLAEAQTALLTDWTEAYRQWIGEP